MRTLRLRTKQLLPLLFIASMPLFAADSNELLGRVDFSSEASITLDNDLLQATLSVEASKDNATLLARELTQKINTAMQDAKAWPSVSVTTGSQNSRPIYDKNNKLESWRGHAYLKIESKDHNAAAEVLAKLQETLQLQNLHFSVSPEAKAASEQQLTKEAIAAFKEHAEQIQEAWGAKGYKLVQMSVGQNNNNGYRPYPVMARTAVMHAEAAPVPTPEFEAGESRVSVSIHGTIVLEP